MNDSQQNLSFERLAKWVQPWLFARRYPDLRVLIDPKTRGILKDLKDSPVIICPNHSRHEDGELIFLFSILTKQPVKFLAAREMFRSYLGFGGVVLRALGCYEVDRGATNTNAVHSIQQRLVDESSKVVIFPEGEISYDNDHVENFEHGAAAIGLESTVLLHEQGRDDDLFLLPVAISYRFDDARAVCLKILDELERETQLPVNQTSVYWRARRVCELYLDSLRQTMKLSSNSDSVQSIDAHVTEIIDTSLRTLAQELNCQLPPTTPLHQIHFLQSRIFSKRKQSHFSEKGQLDKLYAETLNLVRLRSISAEKFEENYSLNSLADLLSNLQVLILRKQTRVPQHVLISACEPIRCRDFFEDFRIDRDKTTESVTNLLANSIQKRLNHLRSNQVSNSDLANA
ncbi:MAG TPA: 1-acyl-sn-glycerol-3-phosphate acyltransferase [Drouetiella sp.]